MAKNLLVNRRTLLTGSTALGGVALLAACGGGSSNSSSAESASALGVGEDIAKLISVNPKERSEVKDGGELKLARASLGPDFNPASQKGNTYDNSVMISALSPITIAGLWQSDYEGNWTINPDFCESFEEETIDGKQTFKIKLNSAAKFNDGTPINVEALKITSEIYRDGLDKGFTLVTQGPYEYVESVEEDGDEFTAKITMSQPYYPYSTLFGYGFGVLHPAMNDVDVFNDGFSDNIHNEWHAGPFKLESWNSSEKVATLVRNDDWWGEKAKLDRIIFRQMESSAQRAAFKNGEIDAVQTNTLTAYKDVEGTAGSEVRRGQRLFSGGINMSSFRLPVELRKAIFAAVDRKALAEVRFNGLNWTEELPGSMMLMPFSEYYRDNFSEATEGWDSAQILEEAGYSKSGDYYQKDGSNAKFAITIFGDDPVNNAMSQTLVQQMKSAGIECTIDSQPDANFGAVISAKDFDMTFSGYTVGSDATDVTSQYYLSSNNNGEGSKEIDEKISEITQIADNAERNAKCNEIEEEHMKEFAMMGTLFNGPEIFVCKTELANYGAALFGSVALDPRIWPIVGWTA